MRLIRVHAALFDSLFPYLIKGSTYKLLQQIYSPIGVLSMGLWFRLKTLGVDIKLRRTSTIIIKYNQFYFLSPHIIRSPMLAKRQIRKRMVPVLEEYISPIHPNKPSTSPNANSPNAIARWVLRVILILLDCSRANLLPDRGVVNGLNNRSFLRT